MPDPKPVVWSVKPGRLAILAWAHLAGLLLQRRKLLDGPLEICLDGCVSEHPWSLDATGTRIQPLTMPQPLGAACRPPWRSPFRASKFPQTWWRRLRFSGSFMQCVRFSNKGAGPACQSQMSRWAGGCRFGLVVALEDCRSCSSPPCRSWEIV